MMLKNQAQCVFKDNSSISLQFSNLLCVNPKSKAFHIKKLSNTKHYQKICVYIAPQDVRWVGQMSLLSPADDKWKCKKCQSLRYNMIIAVVHVWLACDMWCGRFLFNFVSVVTSHSVSSILSVYESFLGIPIAVRITTGEYWKLGIKQDNIEGKLTMMKNQLWVGL